jgi:hypothetical protein
MDLKERYVRMWNGFKWLKIGYRVHWMAVVNTVMKLRAK